MATIHASIGAVGHAEQVYRPVIDGPWWQVAGDPDLGEYTREKQQPVDFGVKNPEVVKVKAVAFTEVVKVERLEDGDILIALQFYLEALVPVQPFVSLFDVNMGFCLKYVHVRSVGLVFIARMLHKNICAGH